MSRYIAHPRAMRQGSWLLCLMCAVRYEHADSRTPFLQGRTAFSDIWMWPDSAGYAMVISKVCINRMDSSCNMYSDDSANLGIEGCPVFHRLITSWMIDHGHSVTASLQVVIPT